MLDKERKIGTANQRIFESGSTAIRFGGDVFQWIDGGSGNNGENTPAEKIRDPGWYHLVFAWDSSAGVLGNRIYVNGVELQYVQTGGGNPSGNSAWNTGSQEHTIGRNAGNTSRYYEGMMSQCYFIDGLTLGPGYFGFTDPLTGTWRPKKFRAEGTTVNDGTVWSNSTNSGLTHADGVTGMFDGSLSTRGGHPSGSNLNSYVTIIDGSLQLQPRTGIRIYWNGVGAGQRFIRINESTELDDGSAQLTPGWSNISSFSGTINKLEVKTAGTGSWSFSAIEIDGIILRDGVTQNLQYGTNGFYLPFDGSAPIGQDQSGQGNDWTPVNFGGSVALDNPQVSGARPILNTTQGGSQAGVGVFGSLENKFYTVTTANGSVYQFDITSGNNPSLEFIRGATYRFDYTSHASHPLRFSSTNPDSSTTAYTDGTNTSVSNVITITVPHNAPDTLYYYCTAHASAMNGSISVTTDETKADPYAWKNVLALPLLGNKEDVSTSINCTSSTRAVSASGNAAAAYESSNFYDGSFEFDGSGDYLDVTESDNCFDFGTGDFTIELWALLENSNDLIGTACNSVFLGSGKSGWVIRRFDSGIKFNYQSNSSWIFENTFGSEGAKDKWNHIAITREGSTIRCFSNGVQQGSDYTSSTNIVSTEGYCRVGGGYGSTSLLVDGYIQDVRIYKGVAKYTSDFIVPATSPNILPDTPSGVSGGSKLAKITDGAVAFDGSNDYLTLPSGTDFAFGTGDFTVECYVYSNNRGTYDYIIDGRTSGQTSGTWSLSYGYGGGNGRLEFASGSSTILECPANLNPESKKWTHIAITRSGTDLRMFIDGVVATSATNSTNFSTAPGTSYIGTRYSQEHFWDGFISNVRVIKGTALYTSAFTPPTAPLTNVTNTKLLCCQSTNDDKDANMGGLYASSSIHTTKADVISNGTLLTAGQSISNQYLYLVPNGDEVESSSVFIFSDDGAVTNSDSSNRWQWIYRNGGSWATTSGSYNTNNWDQFYYGDDTNAYQLNRSRDFYAIFTYGESTTQPYQQSGTAPTITTFAKAAVSPGVISKEEAQQQPPSTHSTLVSTQFVDKRLVMLLGILFPLD